MSETKESCLFSYMLGKSVPDHYDQKSGKWSKIREKSGKNQGIFVTKIEW